MRSSTFLPVLAAIGLATAQSSNKICSQKSVEIKNQGDATTIASSCKKFTGDIIIHEDAGGVIDLNGIGEIDGNLIAEGCTELVGLQGETLASITKTMRLTGLTILSTLSFPALEKVDAIEWTTLPSLDALNFNGPVSQANKIFITDTHLTSLDGINLEQVKRFEVTNNAYLRTISTQVSNITEELIINNNGLNLTLEFPNLTFASNMTVRNVSRLSIPSLKEIKSTFGVYGSYMESVMAPNLTKVGGDVAFVADAYLTNISMPLLQSMGGGLLIANCSSLEAIDGFPSLQKTGAINISGNFTEAEFPKLADVRGTFNAQTSGNFSCGDFNQYKKNQIVKGLYFCKAKSANVQDDVTKTQGGTIASPTGGADADADADADSGAAGIAVSGTAMTFIGFVAAMLTL